MRSYLYVNYYIMFVVYYVFWILLHWRALYVTLLCFGTSVVEQTPDQCQDSGITLHLPQKNQDSILQYILGLL